MSMSDAAEIQATLNRHHKMSHGVPFSLRTLFRTVWLGLCLYFVSGRHPATCTQGCTSDETCVQQI